MVKTNVKKFTLLSMIFAFVLAITCAVFVGTNAKTAKADTVFAFESGAFVKLIDDSSEDGGTNGGLRFRLKMDSDTKIAINDGSDELYFYVGTSALLEDEANYEELVTNKAAVKQAADKSIFYQGETKDGTFWFSNVLLDANNNLKDKEFAVVAVCGDREAKVLATKSLYGVANACALSGLFDEVYGLYNTAMAGSGWYGTADYPIMLDSDEDVSALAEQLSADYSDVKIILGADVDVESAATALDGYTDNIVNTYTVTIDMDGGTLSDGVNNITSLTVDYGTSASTLDGLTKTKTGYTFSKWQYYNGSAYVDLPANATVTGDISIKAVWTINTYTVTVVSNNAGYGKVNAESSVAIADVAYGTAITVDGNVISIGETDVTATATTSDAQYTYAFTGFTGNTATVAGALTITANFTRTVNQYTVTFNTVDGDDLAATEYDYGTLTSTLPEATKSGSTFLYWTLNNGDPLPETITSNITVKAVWGIGTATTLHIATKEAFLSMKQDYHEKELPFITYELDNDIALANSDYTRVECGVGTESATWNRIAYLVESLNTVFDGQGHTISVTYNKNVIAEIDRKVEAYPALFHTIAATGVLRNVKIIAYTLTNFETTSVARWNYGTVENCYIEATHILQHESSKLDYDYVTPEYLRAWFQTNTGEIVANYGEVRNCVFKIMTSYIDGTEYKCSHAVRHTYKGGTFENCSVIGRDATYQFISTDYANLASFGNNPALTFANKDAIRDNCYVFTSVSNLLSGNGGKYNDDGTITAGTYANVKNLYTGTGTYWTAWGFVNYTVTVVSNNAEYGTVSPASVTVPYGTEITINGATLTIGGTVITATPAASTAEYIYAFTDFTGTTATVTSNMEITANFIQAVGKCTVTFNTVDGDDLAATEYDYGTLTSTLPEATKSGSTFLYWTLNNGDPLPETITSNITVKAVWGIGTATTLHIATKEAFLSMKQDYHEKELPFITYELDNDIALANSDYTRVECGVGTESATWNRIAYLVESLNTVFDGKGHTISVTYDKNVLAGIDGKVEAYPALFHTIAAKGVLRNVKIVSYTVTNFETTSVARWNYGTVENCYIEATHILQHEATKVEGPNLRDWFQTNTGEIVANYGTVRNCVFKIMTSYIDGTQYKCSYAVRHTYEGGTFENCSVIGRDATYQFISTDYANLASFGPDPALTFANKDAIRYNCYVFTSVSNLLSGNGGKYNADGTITAGTTYTNVKDLYDRTYWTDWGLVA